MSFVRQLKFDKINIENEIDRVIQTGLNEDLSNLGDVSTLGCVPKNGISNCYFLAKASGIVSGINIVERVFHKVDPNIKFHWFKCNGDYVTYGDQIGILSGNSQSILTSERLALNIMQRMSGIATQTYKMVKILKSIDSKTKLLDTRKTCPGLRILDKIAVTHGGGTNHRMGLYDMIMIKDNHIVASNGIPNAINNAVNYVKSNNLKNIKIEIEVTSLDELKLVKEFGKNKVNRVMLDNMVTKDNYGNIDTSLLVKALQLNENEFETEASGNININSIKSVGLTNVDYCSTGSITHSVTALDISLKFHKNQPKL